jgi:hypothetical protein
MGDHTFNLLESLRGKDNGRLYPQFLLKDYVIKPCCNTIFIMKKFPDRKMSVLIQGEKVPNEPLSGNTPRVCRALVLSSLFLELILRITGDFGAFFPINGFFLNEPGGLMPVRY